MIVAIVLLWVAAVIVLAGRGHKALWLVALIAFPLVVGAGFVLEPSFRGPASGDYVTVGAVVAGVIWVMAGLASAAAWFIGNRARS